MQVCEKQVKTKDEVTEIVKQRDEIDITLDNSDAFTVCLKDFCKGMLLMESFFLNSFFHSFFLFLRSTLQRHSNCLFKK